MREANILVVDDDPSSAAYMALALRDAGCNVRTVTGGVEALLSMERQATDLVISDLQMPEMDGLELLARIRNRWPSVPVMLVTVQGDTGTVVEAVQRGARNYLVKPVAPNVLIAASEKALVRRISPTPGEQAQPQEIVGTSAAIMQVRELVVLASRGDVNVIIAGETGTGKELVARAIHRLSGAAGGPFFAYNCAVTPPELFDSEFFGHRRGAFTGADRERLGILREAHGGVLFLDELECLSLANQAKLLRVLDDGEVRPLGAERSTPVCVRFVAATNRDPELMLERGELRADLYYRLRGFELHLPPLRERVEDIPLLIEHFLRGAGKRLSHRAQQALTHSIWPGNVRQLRTTLERARSVAPGDEIDLQHLDLKPSSRPAPSAARLIDQAAPSVATLRAVDQPGISLLELERRAIIDALDRHGGNRGRAAAALGIHRSTLRRRMRELGITS